ncbi:hypothetical protein [Variovorax paradoxus]|uniref:hypothetical protein n=1 Tax=Variovorax paradoxus TaxID=34073 RepID=UPI0012BC5319|nr:hypothetical protein [Variovorax paradoxus]
MTIDLQTLRRAFPEREHGGQFVVSPDTFVARSEFSHVQSTGGAIQRASFFGPAWPVSSHSRVSAMQTSTPFRDRFCPKCKSEASVVLKTLLIGKQSPLEEKAGGRRPDQLATDECLSESLQPVPLDQFVAACYCTSCGIGFVPEDLIKPTVIASRNRTRT